MIIIGFEVDTIAMEIRLPEQYVSKSLEVFKLWKDNAKPKTLRELLSLAGVLNRRSQIILFGKTFTNEVLKQIRMSSLEYNAKIIPSKGMMKDLDIWTHFLHNWNRR